LRFEIRWHGRGGQGAVTAAEITAMAAVKYGYYAVAFPEFGAERRGAPVKAYTRIDKEVIYEHTPVEAPDAVVVLDPSMIKSPSITAGLKERGYLIVNSKKKPSELRAIISNEGIKLATVDATKIAMDVFSTPIVNTAMIGAFIAVTKLIPLDYVIEAIRDKFPERLANPNVLILKQAHDSVEVEGE